MFIPIALKYPLVGILLCWHNYRKYFILFGHCNVHIQLKALVSVFMPLMYWYAFLVVRSPSWVWIHASLSDVFEVGMYKLFMVSCSGVGMAIKIASHFQCP